ncbi:MAG: hypothetical protein ABL952_01800 [Pyrinomonadaceae bacterium]
MELFQQLGAEIESLWLEQNYNEDLLPAIAKDALIRADLPSKLSAWDVVEWALSEYELPRQRDLGGRFADPPITIFSGLRFHIDVYFWFEGTTATHEHSFCGAFQVLLGSSIHSWYQFETHQAINAFTQLGEMRLKECQLLNVGDAQEIWAGSQYIHALFHLDQPSATIVVRTDRSPLHPPQFSYHKPGFAIDPFFEQDTIIKKLQMMGTLIRAKRDDADEIIRKMLAASDLQTSYTILSHLRRLLKANQISQLFKLAGPKEHFDSFLRMVIDRHGAGGEVLKAVFERDDMLDHILERRSFVADPEHRFFMALLLNVDERERIFSLINQRFPNVDPIEKVLDWVFDLSQTRVVGVEVSNALGIPDFGDNEMFVLEHLLYGKSDADVIAAAESGTSTDDLTASIQRIRNAVIFRPLLS